MDIRSDNFLAVATTEKDFQNIVSKIEEKTSWQTTSIAGMSLPTHVNRSLHLGMLASAGP